MIRTNDVRHVLRRIARSKAFSVAVVIAVAITIGPLLVAASVFDAAFLREVAAKDPARLLVVRSERKVPTSADPTVKGVSFPDYEDLKRALPLALRQAVAAWKIAEVNRTSDTEHPLHIAFIADDYFRLAKARQLRGTLILDDPANVIVSQRLWRQLKNERDTNSIKIYGNDFSVTAIVDDDFHGIYGDEGIDAWL